MAGGDTLFGIVRRERDYYTQEEFKLAAPVVGGLTAGDECTNRTFLEVINVVGECLIAKAKFNGVALLSGYSVSSDYYSQAGVRCISTHHHATRTVTCG